MPEKLGLYSALLDVAREGVRKLDAHPTGGTVIEGDVTLPFYAAYLCQVVHQVRGSAAMLTEAGRRLAARRAAPRLAALLEQKAGEETDHDQWALQDLSALGISQQEFEGMPVRPAVEAYRAYVGYMLESEPIAVLGLAFVLEWYGYARAGRAARNLLARSRIPNIANAVKFLRAHGEADIVHIRTLADAIEEIEDPSEQSAIVLAAQVTSALYLGFFEPATPRGSVASLTAQSA